jgi:thiamine-phosphate diphosphorylase
MSKMINSFLSIKEPIGLYPIVDSSEWVLKVISCGVTTVQLRIKNKPQEFIEQEIIKSNHIAKCFGARLFINDYWQLAIKHQCYGVHLGQGDLNGLNRSSLQAKNLALGISSHSPQEVKRALDFRPSYLAFGPIYHTNTKKMPYSPQGLVKLAQLCQKVAYPVVAIGGINHRRARAVSETGVSGISVLSAITEAEDPVNSIQTFKELIGEQA